LDESCISDPRPEISNWTGKSSSERNLHWYLAYGGKPEEPTRSINDSFTSVPGLPMSLSQQVMRSGLAAAPNYAEATAAESRADFIHKLRIILRELNETKSWLEQIVAAIIAENQELWWIVAASIKTARGSGNPI
jgi:four helix bundle protein